MHRHDARPAAARRGGALTLRHAKKTVGEPATALQRASERIRQAAIELFKARGYHGTSVRDLAQAVRIETASLYYHFPSKQEILLDLFDRTMDALVDGLERAAATGSSPEERLRAAVRFHVLFHVERQHEAFISHSELRSLTAENRKRIIGKRDRYERALRKVLHDGIRAGNFDIPDVKLTSTAILMMCSGVSDWFTRRGRLTADLVADRYSEMVVRLVSTGPGRQFLQAGDGASRTSHARSHNRSAAPPSAH